MAKYWKTNKNFKNPGLAPIHPKQGF